MWKPCLPVPRLGALLVCGFAVATLATPLGPPALAQAVPETVDTDPIRCWWRTSAGAVRMGETFSLVLTCAVLDVDAVRVIPDETKLAASVMQLTPFEVVGGTHPADLRAGQRRFLQYEYVLRAINPDLIGRDVPLPNVEVHYRVNSRIEGNAALEGRDLTYLLPPHSVRVLSMVPAEAEDIRDTTPADFGRVESLLSRAGVLDVVAVTLTALGALVAIFAIVGLVRQARPHVASGPRPAGTFRLARLAARELAAVQREVSQSGWTDSLVARALAAARVTAACALGRTIAQRPLGPDVQATEGSLVLRSHLRRNRRTAVSSAVTADEVARVIDRLPSAATDRRQALDTLRSALATLSVAEYGRPSELDRTALDAALAEVVDQARRAQLRHVWPADAVRRWTLRSHHVEQRA